MLNENKFHRFGDVKLIYFLTEFAVDILNIFI